ncbi:EAL domain-containing protein [Aliidiomarina sanyensis]|uniref:EAL domain-containing protein n=1 Tax=Aliidiomarina sanyensis TaxID=1249555 RepID=A0A432W513_9GAMM|nr:EAL domain-containing protein [Aliidiomarina sanyensis]RUO24941.1 hypothetical protein CWE11_11905 [Aliidiomarina sanyensis]
MTRIEQLSAFFDAIETSKLEVRYKPILNVRDDRAEIIALDCLVYWDEYFDDSSKLEFLFYHIEKNGLSGVVDQHVIERVLSDWHENANLKCWPDLKIMITVCSDSFSNSDFFTFLSATAKRHQFDLNRLILTVRQRIPLEEKEKHQLVFHEARELGIELCLPHGIEQGVFHDYLLSDDFQWIKLRRSLVHLAHENRLAQKYLHNFYDTASNLGKKAYISGVDNDQMMLTNLSNGYSIVSGHYFSIPVSSKEIDTMLAYWFSREIYLKYRARIDTRGGILHAPSFDDIKLESRVVMLKQRPTL